MPYPTQSEKDESAFIASVFLVGSMLLLAFVVGVAIAFII